MLRGTFSLARRTEPWGPHSQLSTTQRPSHLPLPIEFSLKTTPGGWIWMIHHRTKSQICRIEDFGYIGGSSVQGQKMEPGTHKLYHVHEFNSRDHIDTYFSNKPDMIFWDDLIRFPLEQINAATNAIGLQGKSLIDLSLGSFIHHLYPMSDLFEDIILLRFNERCIIELTRWLDMRTGAFDWSHAISTLNDLQGKTEQSEEKEEKLKTAIKHIVKCDCEKGNLTDPVILPQADCLITMGILDVMSQDQDGYIRNLRKFLSLLKPGGHIIIIGVVNATYLTVGGEIFHTFSYDEGFVRKALTEEGLTIDYCEVQRSQSKSDLIDYQGIFAVIAHK